MQNKIIVSTLSLFILVDVLLIYLALTMTPIQLKRNCFTYEYGEKISTHVEDYVNANQKILKSVKLNINNVSTEVGKYKADVEYFGKVYPFEIEVVDTVKPKVQLKQVELQIKLGETLKAKDLIEKVEDNSKTTVYFYDEETKQKTKQKSFVIEGSFIERIIVEDSHGNQSAALRVKIVVFSDMKKPYFRGVQDIEISQGTFFDPMENVIAKDDIDGIITNRVHVKGTVNVDIPGDYTITYIVSDNAGNTARVSRKVTVKEW